MSVTKDELIKTVAADTGLAEKDVKVMLESFIIAVKQTIGVGDEVIIRGWGKFHNQKMAEKTARNLNNNTPIRVPAHNKVAFKAYPEFMPAKLEV